MCDTFRVCGNRHYKVSKYRRNKKGQFRDDRRLFGAFIIVVGILSFSFLGVNKIWSFAKSLETVFLVENTYAEETIYFSWQDEVKSMLRDYGINVEYATKLIQCESSWNPEAVHHNWGSTDYGLWQINNKYHPEVSKNCALDHGCSTLEAIRIIKTKGFNEWSCVSKGLIK